MDMNNIVYGLFLLIIMVCPSNLRTEPAINTVSLENLQGEWLNKKYVEVLQSTKSPREAINGIYYPAFKILNENGLYRWAQIYNFHEGITFNIIGLNPTPESSLYQILFEPIYEPETPKNYKRSTYTDTFIILGGKPVQEIEWIFEPTDFYFSVELPIPFVRVEPNINEYINRLVIAGTYMDEHGRKFVFKESGEAEFPEKSFKYKVMPSRGFSDCDYFYIPSEKDKKGISKSYGFEWNNNRLLLYNLHYYSERSDMREREKEPLYVLSPR